MSLGRFLAAGRSLVGMKDMDSRYQMRSKNLLPKFGSGRNPFCNTPKAESAKAVVAEAPTTPELPKTEPIVAVTSPLLESEELKAVESVEEIKPMAAPEKTELKNVNASAPTKKEPMQFGKWLKKLNLLSYLPIRKPGMKAIAVKPARTHVQTELSLEKVKVMRNDLSDTDLELVRAKKSAAQPKAPQPILQQPVMVKSEPTTWGRLTSRIFGSEQTLIR
ncbi:MAG: hypothetical protein JWQ71_920 [Pedosphaera sp.]|nr:hypothetical protein [Pedosphaera sp.]